MPLNELEREIAKVFIRESPGLAQAVRAARDEGMSKSEVVDLVNRLTRGRAFMQAGITLLVDEIWSESPT